MQSMKRQLAANASDNIAVAGRYAWLKVATGEIFVKTRGTRGQVETAFMNAGDFVRFDNDFEGLDIEDQSGATNDIQFVIADEGEAGKYGNVTIAGSDSLATVADVTLTAATKVSILPVNGERSEAIIQVNADTRIGDTNTGAARGVLVPAGGAIVLTTKAEIFGYSAAGGTATVTETTN